MKKTKPPLCACGCKLPTSGDTNYHIQGNPKVRYIHGHNIAEIHKLAIKVLKGKPLSEEQRRKISVALMGNTKDNNGENNGMFGKLHSSQTKLKISIALKNIWKERQRKKL